MPTGRVISTGGVGWGGLHPAAYSLGRIRRIFHDPASNPNGRLAAPKPLNRDQIKDLRDRLYHALNRYRLAQADDAIQTDWVKAEDRLRRVAVTMLKKGVTTKRLSRLAKHLRSLSSTQRQSLYRSFGRSDIRVLRGIREETITDLPEELIVRLATIKLERRQLPSGYPSQVMLIHECVSIWEQVTGASAGRRTDRSNAMRDPDRSYSAMQAWLEDTVRYVGGDPFTIDRVCDAVTAFKKIEIRPPEGPPQI